MIIPDEKVLQAIVYLESNTNFQVIQDWIMRSALYHASISCSLEGEKAHKEQGKYLVLNELRQALLNARKEIKEIKKPQVSQGAAFV